MRKRSNNERVLQVENGSFTPLVFAADGEMAREFQKFYQRLLIKGKWIFLQELILSEQSSHSHC